MTPRSVPHKRRSRSRVRPVVEALEDRCTPALLPTGVNDFRVSDMGSGGNRLAYAAVRPAVAFNSRDNLYLVVWSGNDTTAGGEPEIHGRLVSGSTGEAVGDDFRISDMGPEGSFDFAAFAPAVAYNSTDNEFFVVWAGDDNTAPLVNDEFEIFGQRLNGTTGARINARQLISDMGDNSPTFVAFSPDVAYNSINNEYLVVWHGDDDTAPLVDSEFEIYGQRIDGATGAEVGTNDFRISRTGNDGDTTRSAGAPAVAYNSADNQYLVVWNGESGTDGKFEIVGQRLSAAGTEVGTDDLPIASMGPAGNANFDAGDPALAYNPTGNEYLVVWQGDDTTDDAFEIQGQRVRADGALLGVSHFPISAMNSDPATDFDAFFPAVAFNSTNSEYLVVWNGGDLLGGRLAVFGQRLNASGAAVGADDFRISQTGVNGGGFATRDAAVVYNGSAANEFLVVWSDNDDAGFLLPTEHDVYAQRLNAAPAAFGERGADFRLTRLAGDTLFDAAQPATAYNSRDDLYLVVWTGDDFGSDQEFEIYGRLFRGATGEPAAPHFRISQAGNNGDTTRAALTPAVAYNGTRNEFLVVWSADVLAIADFEIFGQRLEAATGAAIGNAFLISSMGPPGDPNFDALNPAVAYNSVNDHYLVVWEGNTVPDESEIFGQRMNATGNFFSPNDFRISDMGPDNNPNFGASNPAVAYNAATNQYLVVWAGDDNIAPLVDDEREIFGQLLDGAPGPTAGEVGANDFRISDMGPDGNPNFDAGAPAVAWNAANNEYLVVWFGDDGVDDEFDIYGQRLSSAGAALGANDFRVSDMGPNGNPNFDAFFPAVAYNGASNEYLVVWNGDDVTDDEVEVHGQRLSGAAAAELGVNDFRISDMGPDGSTAFGPFFKPAVAFRGGGSQYLVVWDGEDNTAPLVDNELEIFGQRLELTADAAPAPARAVRAVLKKVRQGNKQVTFVVVLFADTGKEKRRFRSPFQPSQFKGLKVKVEGGQVVLSGRRGGVLKTRRFTA